MESFFNQLCSNDVYYGQLNSWNCYPVLSTDGINKCVHCSEEFKSVKGLEIHINKIHSSEPRIFACKECQKSFKSKHLLKAHVKQVHQKSLRILCQKCQKFFSSKFSLSKHSKKLHLATTSIN